LSRLTCFGIPSIFSFKSETCNNCAAREECRSAAYARLLAVADEPIVKHLISVHQQHEQQKVQALPLDTARPVPVSFKPSKKRELTEQEEDRLKTVPKKVAAYLRSIWTRSKDVEMNRLFKQGKNPFDPERAKPYHLAFETLSNGRISRENLAKSLMNGLGWTYSAAHSQASMILHVLPALGLAEWDGVFLSKLPNNQN
jgi:hypothetical protein